VAAEAGVVAAEDAVAEDDGDNRTTKG